MAIQASVRVDGSWRQDREVREATRGDWRLGSGVLVRVEDRVETMVVV
jgi:hypothetical protein